MNKRGSVERAELWARIRGILLSGIAVTVMVLPIVIWKWQVIDSYYLGQFRTNDSAIRVHGTGTHDFFSRAYYYAHSLRSDHAGRPLFDLAGIFIAIAAVIGVVQLIRLKPWKNGGWRGAKIPNLDIYFSFVAALIPFVTLSLFPSPSPVVIGIVLVPCIVLVVMVGLWLMLGWHNDKYFDWRVATGFAVLTLSTGLYLHANRYTIPSRLASQPDDAKVAVQINHYIGKLALDNSWDRPRLALVTLCDHLTSYGCQLMTYEEHGKLIIPQLSLGFSLHALPMNAAVRDLDSSDIVVLTDRNGIKDDTGYPFVRWLKDFRPVAKEYCEKNLRFQKSFDCYGQTISIYARSKPEVVGITPDQWITQTGLTVRGQGDWIQPGTRIELRGSDTLTSSPRKVSKITAEIVAPGRPPESVPVAFNVWEGGYAIDIELQKTVKLTSGEIHVKFDGYIVPAEHPKIFGPSKDTRKIVFRAPNGVNFRQIY